MDILWGVRWCLIAVSISISLKVIPSIFSCVLWPSGCLPWRYIHLDLYGFSIGLLGSFAALFWAAWAVCMLGNEFIILNICCKHLFSHSEGCLFLSFRVTLVVQKLFRWWGAFLKFCLVLIILSIDSKRTCDSCQSVFAYIFLKRVRVIFRPFNSSSYLDFFFCKWLGRDVNSALSPCLRKRLPVRPDWWQLTLPASV